MATTSLGAGRSGLAAADRARLLRRLETAVRRARRSPAGEVLAAVTVELGRDVDPATVARAWRSLARAAECDAPDGLRATGPVAVGGFAFASEGGAAPHWRGFAP